MGGGGVGSWWIWGSGAPGLSHLGLRMSGLDLCPEKPGHKHGYSETLPPTRVRILFLGAAALSWATRANPRSHYTPLFSVESKGPYTRL